MERRVLEMVLLGLDQNIIHGIEIGIRDDQTWDVWET